MKHLAGPGDQRERLAHACSADMLHMKRKEIPQEVRAEFDALLHLVGKSWTAPATAPTGATLVRALNDAQIAQAAIKVMVIYDQLTRYQPTCTMPFTPSHDPKTGE
ncbi:hypothetical protein GJ699_08190 [Duganella sp. FT80W]|uniref:Uncharacterized protein n=1 Tax=Duganella guangzhouensis TaxID=2666084 RepID=A0A6I2L105_9BURK|nr:hypothetical protein [Duganella guangzhouensis]MRW89959.1 hypothetical protein [Duganella guangzhouensis]